MATKELSLPPREGLAALELEDARKLDALRTKIAHSLDDPRPSVPADDVFDSVERLLASLKQS